MPGEKCAPAVDNLHPTSLLTAAALALGTRLHICCGVRYWWCAAQKAPLECVRKSVKRFSD